MKHYTEPTVTLFYLENGDILTSSGGENDLWGDDIFDELVILN